MTTTHRNVEIKAKIRNLEALIKKCEEMTGSSGEIFPQEDYFFYTTNGRMKMRFHSGTSAELIYYERYNVHGPKLSTYQKYNALEGKDLCEVLSSALGVRGTVIKTRLLFRLGQTRIQIDTVEDLGTFIELEICLDEEQTEEEGLEIAKQLMTELDIQDNDLISEAYIDLLI